MGGCVMVASTPGMVMKCSIGLLHQDGFDVKSLLLTEELLQLLLLQVQVVDLLSRAASGHSANPSQI